MESAFAAGSSTAVSHGAFHILLELRRQHNCLRRGTPRHFGFGSPSRDQSPSGKRSSMSTCPANSHHRQIRPYRLPSRYGNGVLQGSSTYITDQAAAIYKVLLINTPRNADNATTQLHTAAVQMGGHSLHPRPFVRRASHPQGADLCLPRCHHQRWRL